MSQATRTRLATAFVLVAVFGTGVLVGFAADSSLDAETPEYTTTLPDNDSEAATGSDGEEGEEVEAERRYTFHEVHPNEEQLARIYEIVDEHRARTNALDEEIRAGFRADFRAITLDTREAIMGVLTAQQAADYQRLLDERDAARDAAAGGNEDDQR